MGDQQWRNVPALRITTGSLADKTLAARHYVAVWMGNDVRRTTDFSSKSSEGPGWRNMPCNAMIPDALPPSHHKAHCIPVAVAVAPTQ